MSNYLEAMHSSNGCDCYSVRSSDKTVSSKLSSPASHIYDCIDADMASYHHNKQLDGHHDTTMQSPITMTYGPIHVTVRRSVAPTLATGRRSKFVKLEGDAALKREMRRKRNREAARKLKAKRIQIEDELKTRLQDLETEEQTLLLRVRNLEAYKEHLELQYQQAIAAQTRLAETSIYSAQRLARSRQINQSVPVHYVETHIKSEPRSPSPNWQRVFSI